MNDLPIEIVPYQETHRDQLVTVWEASVRATHGFLDPADIDYFKSIVMTIDFRAFPVYCLLRGKELLGFLGVSDQKIEMLFLSPACIGQGWGKKLVRFAIDELQADKVDVNEQNLDAVRFYKKCGFEVYDRTEKDSTGKDYPILQMRLSPFW